MANATPTASTEPGNPHAQAARAAKVQRIVTALVTGKNVTAANLEATATVIASATPWGAAMAEAIARRLGEHTLSLTTRAMVAERLTEIAAVMASMSRGDEVSP